MRQSLFPVSLAAIKRLERMREAAHTLPRRIEATSTPTFTLVIVLATVVLLFASLLFASRGRVQCAPRSDECSDGSCP